MATMTTDKAIERRDERRELGSFASLTMGTLNGHRPVSNDIIDSAGLRSGVVEGLLIEPGPIDDTTRGALGVSGVEGTPIAFKE